MKKSTLFLAVMAAFIAVIFSVLAGCASTGAETGGAATANAAAKQLAKDLKAAKPGSTVTLSGGVEIKTGLTVPEGVTLDLTADGAALELQDGAVLTVNGTVKTSGHGDYGKGWVEGSLRIGDGAAVINGSRTLYLKSKGRLLNIGGDRDCRRQITLDGVTLVGLQDNSESLVEVNNGGELVLKSGEISGNTRVSDKPADGGGISVHKGAFTMSGGEISGNNRSGVIIHTKSIFTMSGGMIYGNTSPKDGGGGVAILEDSFFTMTDGAIFGNSVVDTRGGGVNLYNATFTMFGGRIQGNTDSDGFAANTVTGSNRGAALQLAQTTARWGRVERTPKAACPSQAVATSAARTTR